MRKPDTDESNVQMSDVLCDFCSRVWTEDIAMIEGHQGSCICGNCLSLSYVDLVLNENDTSPDDWDCGQRFNSSIRSRRSMRRGAGRR